MNESHVIAERFIRPRTPTVFIRRTSHYCVRTHPDRARSGGRDMELIAATSVSLTGKSALVVANSEEFCAARSLAHHRGASPTFASPDAPDLADRTRAADVLIVAVGQPRSSPANTQNGAIVIDVGSNREGEKTVGDVDALSAKQVAGHLTPVPGGVGPMTVAMLIANVVQLAKSRRA